MRFGAGSVGTFDRPFGSVAAFESLADAEQSGFDIILVRGRNDGTDTNLNTTITLFDDQQLLGTGGSHFVSTTQGLAPLPDLPFSTPLLSNSAAPGTEPTDVSAVPLPKEASAPPPPACSPAVAALGLCDHEAK